MWPVHLSHPRAGTSERSKPRKKRLQEHQQNYLHGSEKIRKKNKRGGKPTTNTTGVCNSREGAARDQADPEPRLPSGTVGAARVKSVTGPKNNKDVERGYQCLLLSLDWSKLRHQQLFSEIHQLKQVKKELQEQQQEENEKLAQVQETLKAELEDHKVATQMLLSEKGHLQSALAHMEQEVKRSQVEHEDLTSRLQACQQRSLDLEMALSALTTTQKDIEQNNRQLIQDLGDVKLQLEEKSRSCDNLQELNADLQGKLDVLRTQKSNMKLKIEKFRRVLEERAVLKRRIKNVPSVVSALRLERDKIAEDLRVERSTWTEKVRRLSQEMNQLTDEREEDLWQMVDLENKLAEMENKLAEAQPPAGPSQADLKNLEQQLQFQVQENQSLSLQNLEQQERLLILQKKVDDKAQSNIFETQKCTDLQMRELKEQLEQLQEAFHRLSTEEDQLTSLLTSEQKENEHLLEKLEQREMELGEWKEVAEGSFQTAQSLQELNAQYLAQLQEPKTTCEENMASIQQLSAEKEELQQHLLRHAQLLEQQQQQDLTLTQELQDTLQCLEATTQEKEQLQAQLSFLAFQEGKEGDKEEARAEEATPAAVTIPEAVDIPQVMKAFYPKAKSVAEVTKVKLSQQLEQQAYCQCLANLAAQCQTKLEQQALFPKSKNHGPSGDRKQDTWVSKKIRMCFLQALPDKVEHQSPAGDLQHRCAQLSKHISTLDDSIMLYKEQMEVLDQLYKEKDECVMELSQEKMQKKEELQELLVLLVGEGTQCQGQTPADPETPAAEVTSHLPSPSNIEDSKEQKIFADAQLKDSVQPAQVEAGGPCPRKASTPEPTVMLMPDTQPSEELSGQGNEQSRSSPFFSRLRKMMCW